MTLPKFRIMVFLISLLGLVVPFFGGKPVLIMIISQALNVIILPLTVACIFYLANRKDLMGGFKNSLISNIILAAILLFSLFTAVIGVKGVWDKIQKELKLKTEVTYILDPLEINLEKLLVDYG